MSTPVRFPGGVTNVTPISPLKQYGNPSPMTWHTYFNDFDTYVAADWTVTVVGTTPTAALTDINGGALLLTNAATDNSEIELQKKGESFLLTAGKKTIFKARFKVSDATQSDFVIGLAITDTTLLGAIDGAGVTDGIFFSKDDGDALLDVQCQLNATTGQTRAAGVYTVVDDTFMTVSMYYDGVDRLEYFVDDVLYGALDASATYLPDTELTVSVAFMNGEAVSKLMTIDYIFAAQER